MFGLITIIGNKDAISIIFLTPFIIVIFNWYKLETKISYINIGLLIIS